MASPLPTNENLHALVHMPAKTPMLNPEEAAREMLRNRAQYAAMTVCDIAEAGTPADKVKLDAAKYVLDRVLGKVGMAGTQDEIVTKYFKEAEMYANQSAEEGSGEGGEADGKQ